MYPCGHGFKREELIKHYATYETTDNYLQGRVHRVIDSHKIIKNLKERMPEKSDKSGGGLFGKLGIGRSNTI